MNILSQMDMFLLRPGSNNKFFQNLYGGLIMRNAEPDSADKPFYSLFGATTTFSSIIYLVLIYVVLYTLIITLVLHCCKLVLSHSPRTSAEAKGKIMRTLVIAFCSCGVAGFIAIIASAFVV